MVLRGPKEQVPICSRIPGASHTLPLSLTCCSLAWVMKSTWGVTKDQSQLNQEDFPSTFTDWYCSNIINIYFGGIPKSLEEKMVTISCRLIFQKKLIWNLVLAKVLFSIDQISVQRKTQPADFYYFLPVLVGICLESIFHGQCI